MVYTSAGSCLAKPCSEDLSAERMCVIRFTKCGFRVPGPGAPEVRSPHYDTSAAHIVKSADNSLRRLQTDYLDIFLLNHFDHVSNLEETTLALLQLKEAGKIRSIGVCNFSVFQHQLPASYLKLPIVTNHIELDLLNTGAIDNGQIDYIKQRYYAAPGCFSAGCRPHRIWKRPAGASRTAQAAGPPRKI